MNNIHKKAFKTAEMPGSSASQYSIIIWIFTIVSFAIMLLQMKKMPWFRRFEIMWHGRRNEFRNFSGDEVEDFEEEYEESDSEESLFGDANPEENVQQHRHERFVVAAPVLRNSGVQNIYHIRRRNI